MRTTAPAYIGRYQILDRLAEGGMGSLYLARDPAIERLVAIKLLRVGFDSEDARARFALEARAAGRLHHPHVVTVFDVGEHDGSPFIAMEFLAGETLGQLIRQQARLTLPRKLKLIEELCDGLAYAHRAGLVHRDIKPANVMVDAQGVLKILDFGIVRITESAITGAGEIVGTVNYMSPEQVGGGTVDHRSDIFSVGVVAYELLSYRQAFPGSIREGLLERIVAARVVPLGEVVPTLDPDVVQIVERAMAPRPEDRYQDLARMRNDVARVRGRVELEEARADSAFAEETAVFARPLLPGADTEAPGTGGRLLASARRLAEAEQALATGQYQAALLLASRTAAVQPEDGHATAIVERARTGLLAMGRERVASAAGADEPAAAAGDNASAGTVRPTASPRDRRVVAALSGVLVVAVAGTALWTARSTRPEPSTPVPAAPVQAGSAVPSTTPAAPAAEPRSARDAEGHARQALEARQPERALDTLASGLDRAPFDSSLARMLDELLADARARARSARDDAAAAGAAQRQRAAFTEGRERTREAERLAASGERVQAVREFWLASEAFSRAAEQARPPARVLPDADAAGPPQPTPRPAQSRAQETPGRVASNAPAAAASPQPDPPVTSVPGGRGEPTGAPAPSEPSPGNPLAANVPSIPPPASLPAAAAPPAASAASPAPPAGKTATTVDPRAPEEEVRKTLRAYQAAWESLDAAALARVQLLSPDEAARVQRTMAAAQAYHLTLAVTRVELSDDGRRASATCEVTREFDPRIGRASRQSGPSTFELERRNGAWLIVRLR